MPPITVTEKHESRETVDGESIILVYNIEGTADDDLAMDALKLAAPSAYNGLARQAPTIAVAGVNLWLGTVPYGRPESTWASGSIRETGDAVFTFEAGAETQRVMVSHQGGWAPDVPRYPVDTAPDFERALNVDSEGVPRGVDKIVPVYKWTETHYIEDHIVTLAYRTQVGRLVGSVNESAFRGWDAEEVLFMGATGSRRGDDADWEITFRFAAHSNLTDFSVGSIDVASKKGWEYLWVYYDRKEVAGPPKRMVTTPAYVYIERIYWAEDFSDLGIGT